MHTTDPIHELRSEPEKVIGYQRQRLPSDPKINWPWLGIVIGCSVVNFVGGVLAVFVPNPPQILWIPVLASIGVMTLAIIWRIFNSGRLS